MRSLQSFVRGALLGAPLFFSACGHAPIPETARPIARPITITTARTSPAPVATSFDRKAEPSAEELTKTRLVAGKCVDDPRDVDALVKKMRAEIDEQFMVWHRAQPDCWHHMWLEQHAHLLGLGLTGIGEGGGGSGEGIGLGSIGTIGHGAGTGTGQGFGSGAGRLSARQMSKTNLQVAGVDEADIVKTDGRFVYLAANGALRIVEAINPRVLSVTKIPGAIRDLFIDGDRAVVYASSAVRHRPCSYGYDCRFAGDRTSTRVVVLDVADRAKPKAVRTIELSGSLVTSRRIGSAVHTVVVDGDSELPQWETWPADLGTCGTDEKFVRQKFAQLKWENEKQIRASVKTLPTMKDGGVTKSLCAGSLRTASGDGRTFTTLVSFDLTNDKASATTAMIQSRPGAVFASGTALYLAVAHPRHRMRGSTHGFYSSVDEVSDVHKFRIGSDPGATRYLGSGVVPGHTLNQFAMDERDGHLRVATSRGRVPDPNVSSEISVLTENEDHNLVRVGAIQNIAPGEDIRAVRFDGDRGYIVTFKKTDPLFVIDLKDPKSPRILGELKIPGFSTYMHRIDDNHLLSIGFDADDKGDFAFFDGLILQLFDVADPTKPKLLHKEKIGTRGSSSEAATNHLAFNYFAERGMLAVPMTICEGGGNGSFGHELSFSGLLIYEVSVAGGFKRLGGIDHGRRDVSCSTWWSNATSAVKRSIFLDDLVYSIATDRVKVQRLGHFGSDVADITLLP